MTDFWCRILHKPWDLGPRFLDLQGTAIHAYCCPRCNTWFHSDHPTKGWRVDSQELELPDYLSGVQSQGGEQS